jgi:hypothetical protein
LTSLRYLLHFACLVTFCWFRCLLHFCPSSHILLVLDVSFILTV